MAALEEIVCRDLVALVTDYLEGALAPDPETAVEAHLDACEDCRAYVDQMRATVGALRELRARGVPPQRRRELLELFRSWAGPGG